MARLEVQVASGSVLQLYQAMWGPVYEAVLSILGSTGTILPIGDPHHGQPNATAFTTVGGEQVTFTWSEAPNSFDTKLDLTDRDSIQGIIPIVDFNGTDEEADTPDAAYWSRDDSGSNPWSVGAWINVSATAARQTILSKYGPSSANREWIFRIEAEETLRLVLADDSAGITISRVTDSAIPVDTWTHVVATYDSTGGSDAMGTSGSVQDNVTLYVDGAIVASTATDNASYVAMEGLSAVVELGMVTTNSEFFAGKMAGGPLGLFFTQKEITPDEVLRLYEVGRRALGL